MCNGVIKIVVVNIPIIIIPNIFKNVKSILLKKFILFPNESIIQLYVDIGIKIKRNILHREIIDAGYYSSYEPCIYPGVNIKYYHNPLVNNFGICDCDKPCNGKGKDNTCKKITIVAFKSGKIIITGGRSKDNIQTAYKFITNFINNHKDQILIK